MTTRHLADPADAPSARIVPSRALGYFVLITFAITWGIAGTYIFFPGPAEATLGRLTGLHPLYFLATWAPGIAGVVLVSAYGGWPGLRGLFSRVLLWRCAAHWWLLILIGFPQVFAAGSLLKGGPLLAPVPEDGLGAVLVVSLVMLFLGPVEEFGWRGLAQPILQRHVALFWAGIIIGLVWGLWHLPAFYLSGLVYADWNFLTFLIGNVTMAVLVTPIFNAAKGSLLLPMLFHWQLILPVWPDAQPWDTWILLALTVAVVWLYRDTMFSRQGAVTRVVPARG